MAAVPAVASVCGVSLANCSASYLLVVELTAAVVSSLGKPALERHSLNHWTTREVPSVKLENVIKFQACLIMINRPTLVC